MLLRTLIAGHHLLAAGAFAQLSSFPKPTYFRETFSKSQTKVELKDPVRLKDFVVGRQAGTVAEELSGAGDGE